ncbi:FAD-dependent monooxygenase [Dactylosporangium sp. NPDC050688]|uniref:FAD-dependent monooxygenase n=1 Tax=Dactylosporangium sp. NPDC050688 TaxID=3157217 RepID=UPI0033C5F42D
MFGLPLGEDDLNVGIVDAANLGWKLAAVVRGWAGGHPRHVHHRTAPGRGAPAAEHPGPRSP